MITPPRVPIRSTMQVRFFRGPASDELERRINDFLAERPEREIVDVRQSVASGGGDPEVLVSVWFVGE